VIGLGSYSNQTIGKWGYFPITIGLSLIQSRDWNKVESFPIGIGTRLIQSRDWNTKLFRWNDWNLVVFQSLIGIKSCSNQMIGIGLILIKKRRDWKFFYSNQMTGKSGYSNHLNGIKNYSNQIGYSNRFSFAVYRMTFFGSQKINCGFYNTCNFLTLLLFLTYAIGNSRCWRETRGRGCSPNPEGFTTIKGISG